MADGGVHKGLEAPAGVTQPVRQKRWGTTFVAALAGGATALGAGAFLLGRQHPAPERPAAEQPFNATSVIANAVSGAFSADKQQQEEVTTATLPSGEVMTRGPKWGPYSPPQPCSYYGDAQLNLGPNEWQLGNIPGRRPDTVLYVGPAENLEEAIERAKGCVAFLNR